MPRGSKAKYTEKQKRQASAIEAGYEDKGLPKEAAEARAWATVNKQSGGGEKSSGGGAHTSAARKTSARRDSARRAAASREGKPRSSGDSLSSQSKASLLKEARSQQIPGRSKMNKQQLVDALRRDS
jgi:hypothetical protein